jgi:hypothetical protein
MHRSLFIAIIKNLIFIKSIQMKIIFVESLTVTNVKEYLK